MKLTRSWKTRRRWTSCTLATKFQVTMSSPKTWRICSLSWCTQQACQLCTYLPQSSTSCFIGCTKFYCLSTTRRRQSLTRSCLFMLIHGFKLHWFCMESWVFSWSQIMTYCQDPRTAWQMQSRATSLKLDLYLQQFSRGFSIHHSLSFTRYFGFVFVFGSSLSRRLLRL